MRSIFRIACLLAVTYVLGLYGWGQSNPSPTSADTQKNAQQEKKNAGPVKEMGKGGEDVGKGVAKGTGDMAKGTAGAVGSLAHGNFGGAGASLGKGAGGLGKNVVVGTGKGVGKIGKGIGGEFKKLGGKKQHDEKS